MTYNFVAGETAELVVGDSVELVSVRDTWACGHREVIDSAGRRFVVSGGALRPALPEPYNVTDPDGDALTVTCADGHVVFEPTTHGARLTPDHADHLADAVKAMARAIRGREQR